MRQSVKSCGVPILLLGLVLLVGGVALQAGITDVLTESFQVEPGGTLYIESDLGEISVLTHNQNTVEVKVVREAQAGNRSKAEKAFENFTVEIEQEDDGVRITGDKKESGFSLFNMASDLRVKYEIRVPAVYSADLKTADGSIAMGDLDGKVQAQTAGGSLKFGNIAGPILGSTAGGSIELKSCGSDVKLRTAGGSVQVGDVNGDAQVTTSGGSIRIGEVQGKVEAETSGGSIRIEGVAHSVKARTSGGSVSASLLGQPRAECSLSTSAGGVTVTIPENVQLNIKARTFGGKVHTDLPLSVKGDLSQSRIEGTLNGGGPILKLETMGGNIAIYKGREVL